MQINMGEESNDSKYSLGWNFSEIRQMTLENIFILDVKATEIWLTNSYDFRELVLLHAMNQQFLKNSAGLAKTVFGVQKQRGLIQIIKPYFKFWNENNNSQLGNEKFQYEKLESRR